jgi:hypothetical protein
MFKIEEGCRITWSEGGGVYTPVFRSGHVTDISRMAHGIVKARGEISRDPYDVKVADIRYCEPPNDD